MANLWLHTTGSWLQKQAAWTEPDEDDWRNARPNKFGKKPHELHGNVGHVDEFFQGSSKRPTPWGSSGSMGTKTHHAVDMSKVHEMLRSPTELEDVDPRTLTATQPELVRSAVQHYLDTDYHKTGRTYENSQNKGNEHPVIYQHENGKNFIMSGHHRAAAALFKGVPLRARVVRGGSAPRG